MNKISFLNKVNLAIYRLNIRPRDFAVLCLIAELSQEHESVTIPMMIDATSDTTIRNVVTRLHKSRYLVETDKLPKGIEHDYRTQFSYKLSAAGLKILDNVISAKGGEA